MPPVTSFSKSDLVEKAWEITKANFWFLVSLAFVVMLISNVPGIFSDLFGGKTEDISGFGIAIVVLIWIIQIFLSLGVINISLKLARGEKAAWSDIWEVRHLFWRYIGASIIYGLIVFFGLILLLVPGIIWGIKYQFYTYALIDKDLGIWQAMHESSSITQGHKWNLFLFNILLTLIVLLGVILLVVGMFVAIPVTWLATALAYLYLVKNNSLAKQPANKLTEKEAAT